MLLLALFAVCVYCAEDFYKVLGVKKTASERDIKKAYLKLSKQYHPDKNPGDDTANKKFIEISEAYQVLSDAEKRRVYDQHGHEGLKQQGQGGHHMDPFDLFSQFGFGGGMRQQQQEEQRAPDVTMELHVTLEDLYKGKTLEVGIRNQMLCPKCRGTGARSEDDVHKCHSCQGRGVKTVVQQLAPGFVQQMQTTCDVCGGKGKIVKSKCPICKGEKLVTGQRVLDATVEPGMADGATIEFENAGDEHPDHAAGHIIFKVVTQPHSLFVRDGNNLRMTMHISLREALVGFSKYITHLDGRQVEIKQTGVTKPGHVQRVVGEGMPHHGTPSRKGDLLVTYVVDFPAKLTPQQAQGFAEILK